MAKFIHNSVTDAALNKIGTGTIITVCSQQPTTRTEAVTTYKLADDTLAGGNFSVGAGGGGRRVTISEKADIPVDTTGTATHVAICDATNVLLVTTCTSQAVTSGNTVTIPSFSHTIGSVT